MCLMIDVFHGTIVISNKSLKLKDEELTREARFWTYMFVLLGVASGLSIAGQVRIFFFLIFITIFFSPYTFPERSDYATGHDVYARACLQTWSLTYATERLMMRLRAMAFTNLLRQSVGWFDNKDSSPGSLTTKLAKNVPIVKAVCEFCVHIVITYTVRTVLGSDEPRGDQTFRGPSFFLGVRPQCRRTISSDYYCYS